MYKPPKTAQISRIKNTNLMWAILSPTCLVSKFPKGNKLLQVFFYREAYGFSRMKHLPRFPDCKPRALAYIPTFQ